ncbi:MAG: chorismate--pyruvate lyase family protein [Vibrio sp.]
MNKSTSLYLSGLCKMHWQSSGQFSYPSTASSAWLQEVGSLSQRLAQSCHQLKVKVINNQPVAPDCFMPIEYQGLPCEAFWVRDVMLYGDEQPWVVARTLMPLSMIDNASFNLAQLGDKPLGLTVFDSSHARRDQLEAAYCPEPHTGLLARRSRLWSGEHAMLVSEIFLPESPIYK